MTAPPENLAAKVAAWMRHVDGDLTIVEIYLSQPTGRVPSYLAGFHAQQAAEKALKGLLIGTGQEDFPFSHDIRLLLELLSQRHPWAIELREAEVLTTYATWARYPGPWDHPSREEIERVALLARRVIDRVRQELAARGFPHSTVHPPMSQ